MFGIVAALPPVPNNSYYGFISSFSGFFQMQVI